MMIYLLVLFVVLAGSGLKRHLAYTASVTITNGSVVSDDGSWTCRANADCQDPEAFCFSLDQDEFAQCYCTHPLAWSPATNSCAPIACKGNGDCVRAQFANTHCVPILGNQNQNQDQDQNENQNQNQSKSECACIDGFEERFPEVLVCVPTKKERGSMWDAEQDPYGVGFYQALVIFCCFFFIAYYALFNAIFFFCNYVHQNAIHNRPPVKGPLDIGYPQYSRMMQRRSAIVTMQP